MDAAICEDDVIATLLVNAPRADARSVECGQLIGRRYRIERTIGRGGFGAVFAARHVGTGQQVAIKCLSFDAVEDGEADVRARRFFQEARVTAGLHHANNIRVLDFGQDDTGLLYIAMELLEGRTLAEEIRRRRDTDTPFSQDEVVAIATGIARGLSEAHAANLVHRDLKPDNVFLIPAPEGDLVKVLDFGIVRVEDSTLTQSSDSGIPGTPAYMSPEQAKKGWIVDGRSDLYSLGVILYQLLSGRVPFEGDDVVHTLYLHATMPPEDLTRTTRTPISPALATLVHAMLAKTPDGRPSSARKFRKLLARAAEEPASIPSTDGSVRIVAPPLPAARAPNSKIAMIAAAAVFGAVFGVLVLSVVPSAAGRHEVVEIAPTPPAAREVVRAPAAAHAPAVAPASTSSSATPPAPKSPRRRRRPPAKAPVERTDEPSSVLEKKI